MKCKAMILLCVVLLLGACKINKPSLPVWDVDLKIPLINEHYYVSDLVDSVHIVVDGDDLVYLTTEGDLETNVLEPVALHPNISETSLPVLSGFNAVQTIAFGESQDSATLSYGEVASGEIKIRVGNIHPDAGNWLVELDVLTISDAQGNPLHLEYTKASSWQSIDLRSYRFGILDNDVPIHQLDVQFTSSSALPEGSTLAEVSFEISQPIEFHLFQGRFSNYEILATDSASNLDIEYPHHLDEAITLSDAYVDIAVSNQMSFSCEFEGFFKATRGDTEIIIPILDDNGNKYRIEAATVDNPTHLRFRNRIAELIQIMPDYIEVVDVKFTIDSASGFGTIRDTDVICAHYVVLAPFRFLLNDSSIIMDEPTRISISAENQERIRKNVLDAAFSLKALNNIPVGATAFAYFANNENIDINDPMTYSFIKQVTLGSSLTHPDWQELELLNLSQSELDLFSAPEVYLRWVFHFEESSDLVEIYAGPNDFIWIKGQILASLRVKDL